MCSPQQVLDASIKFGEIDGAPATSTYFALALTDLWRELGKRPLPLAMMNNAVGGACVPLLCQRAPCVAYECVFSLLSRWVHMPCIQTSRFILVNIFRWYACISHTHRNEVSEISADGSLARMRFFWNSLLRGLFRDKPLIHTNNALCLMFTGTNIESWAPYDVQIDCVNASCLCLDNWAEQCHRSPDGSFEPLKNRSYCGCNGAKI
jgi:hypothetical protein